MNPYGAPSGPLAHPRVRVLAWQPGRVQDSTCITVHVQIDGWIIIRGIYVWEGRANEPMFRLPAPVSLHDPELLAELRLALHGEYYRHVDTATLLMRD